MNEVEIKHRDRILEAIDQLRQRKARPDSPRICNYMMRRFSVDCKDTKAALQKCVENEIVFKVEYKGDISYRNAAKWNHKHKPGDIIETSPESDKNNGSFMNILTSAMSELIFQEPDYLELGVPDAELIKTILSKSNVKYSKKHLMVLIQKEVYNGGLIKLENGRYSLGAMPMDTDKSDDELPSPSFMDIDSSVTSPPPQLVNNALKMRKKIESKTGEREYENDKDDKSNNSSLVGYRVGGRKKLAKKVFDPSDNNLPKRKRGRPLGSLNKSTIEKQAKKTSPRPIMSNNINNRSDTPTGGVCSVCHQAKKGYNEKLISCRDCSNKAHQTCLNSEDGMLRLRPDNTWQCPHCKTCVICFETSDAGLLTVCYICSDAYHSKCHEQKNNEKLKIHSKWICDNCQSSDDLAPTEIKPKVEKFDDKIYAENETPVDNVENSHEVSRSPTPPPVLSPQANHDNDNSNSSAEYKFHISESGNEYNNDSNKSYDITEDNYDPNIPDATNWTYEDVFQYFSQYFPEDALVFKEQEIDGQSLLLMKRADVLTNLNLKLGPALKIYKHVLKLQIRRDDPKLGWF